MILRKGEILYSGEVGGMNSKDGFFELISDNLSDLKVALEQHPAIENMSEENGKITAFTNTNLEASELNQYLVSKNIFLSHLVKRKHSLEEQFLELTKNN